MFISSLNIVKIILSAHCDLVIIARHTKLLNKFSLLNEYELISINRNYITISLKLGFEQNKLKIKMINLYESRKHQFKKMITKLHSRFIDIFNNTNNLITHSFNNKGIYEILALINNY
mmetsp:Transcript_8376/g.11516  ORF Transcript_8376/g.11516 Transcript_8376/m.11516 type:complete len:118 (+) Transcript_8376:691-1044(+)